MNSIILMGRLTADPTIRTTRRADGTDLKIANIRIAVDRTFKREGQPEADFFNAAMFGKRAEFAEKYLKKGTKVVLQGSMQNDNYEKEGQTIYRNVVMVDNIEFAESKKSADAASKTASADPAPVPDMPAPEGFMDIPEGMEEQLPFN